jgi:hypothetical protein
MPFKDKAPVIQNLLNEMARGMYGRTVSEALENNVCVSCGTPMLIDWDVEPADWREYQISGLCPTCFKESC